MSAPDIAGVLGRHSRDFSQKPFVTGCAECDESYRTDADFDAHLADAIRAELRAWLESEGVGDEIVRQANAEDDRHFAAGSSHGLGASEAVRLTLAALAEQVGRVDPSQSDSGSTGIEVCQSADQTSTAGVEG